MDTGIDDSVRRLYEEPPDGFVATRSAAIEEARKAGDRDAAKRLAALKKPTVAAWVVNLLAIKRPDLIEELVELSSALRSAQRDLQGDQLRELSTQRRQFVSAMVAAARKLAVAAGVPAARLPLGEVEATLTAALAEPEIAEQVRTGRLIRAATYAGFGEVPRPRLRLVTDTAEADISDLSPEERARGVEAGSAGGEAEGWADGSAAAESDWSGSGPDGPGGASAGVAGAGGAEGARERAAAQRRQREAEQRRRELERKRRELEREMATALAAERRADAQLERAETAERDAGHLVEDLDAELAELERRRTEAVADVARRKLARRTAERESAAARRRVGDVQAALDDLAPS
ncbi:hypothetical protein AMIS_74580 [Actinoplanes missouriensis 431]|uniref:Uncharacterized protein n=1 Tax=Actinoplanes missouriensis (strain ATCC 14538 / DSM 43046 / CBS 188.64 / JCM 3121 / NBRC 102363 / NCIMB 12654 / NRRL B-3342 / UNCC 431) TaxID=512565 RepID=I0HI41_ACTM4|nr:hypothetical protein [Actinoplanes missouriensis]BAL92678.1 hypothetical protein AMIS_74580 [Actinoplanes missouriensis 431]